MNIDIDKIIKKEIKKRGESMEYNTQDNMQDNKQDEIPNEQAPNDTNQNINSKSLVSKENNNSIINSGLNNTGDLMDNIKTPTFAPKLDTTKDLEDQASDVVKVMGAQKASQDETFMQDVSKNFQQGVLTDQETKNMKKQRLLEQEYFLKWQDVLQFAFIKSPHGLLFMRIMTIIAMLVYVPLRVIGMGVKSIGTLGDFINDIFNSIFGGKGTYLKDKDGKPVIDPSTNKPYIEKQGYNLFAKLLFGIVIAGLGLALVFVFVNLFTGFNIFTWLRNTISQL